SFSRDWSSDVCSSDLGFLGFGEAGSKVATGLRAGGLDGIVAYDIAWQDSELVRSRADEVGVELLKQPGEVAARADVVISAVVCKSGRASGREREEIAI